MTPPNRTLLFVVILTQVPFFAPPSQSCSAQSSPNSGYGLIDSVRAALLTPEGHEFSVLWEYAFGQDSWAGDGTLRIKGSDLLRLTLPFQEILIKDATVMTWYRETDQVIIDHFDRNDPSNLFSLLLGQLSAFSLENSSFGPDSLLNLDLVSETMVGFEELKIVVDPSTWLPELIVAKSGEDIETSVTVIDVTPLRDPTALMEATLTGSEVIDLRE